MPTFRKRPVEIEARRVPTYPQPRGRETSIVAYVDDCVALAEWCGGRSHMMNAADSGIEDHILIPTLEGDMRALPGDWIVKGVKGEFYPCKPDVFAATYERVEPGAAATDRETTTRVFAALHRSAEQDVSRVIDLYERWVKAGPPPLGTPIARWWDARLVELHDAILPPADQTKEK